MRRSNVDTKASSDLSSHPPMTHRCSYCGKEFPISVSVCPYDQEPLGEKKVVEPPRIPGKTRSGFMSMLSGLFVLVLAFLEPLLFRLNHIRVPAQTGLLASLFLHSLGLYF